MIDMALEEGRASKAYDFVYKVIKDFEKEDQKKYKSYVKKLPMLIKTNGLGSALAFIYSKKEEKAYFKIYEQISEWLVNKNLVGGERNLIEAIVQENSYEYRIITNEVIELLTWMKRFVEGMIEDDNK